jgi:hypothetical protein
MDNSWVSKLTGVEAKVKLYNCRKRDRQELPVQEVPVQEVPVPTRTVCKEELSFTRNDMT